MDAQGPYRNVLVVATGNRGKLEEIRTLLDGLAVEVRGVAELLPSPPRVVEDGATFADNAVKKAKAVAQATLSLTLADDSGLEVDALGGRPGVHSARFAGDRATDAENNAALLAALGASDAPEMHAGGLSARFRCVLALVDPFTSGGEAVTVEGVCEGVITRTPRGSGGFGYDPLFVVCGSDKTMAELSADEKNRISHRAQALAALRPVIERVIEERNAQVARTA
jgi:XTP/dITP diphosphohydrolase